MLNIFLAKSVTLLIAEPPFFLGRPLPLLATTSFGDSAFLFGSSTTLGGITDTNCGSGAGLLIIVGFTIGTFITEGLIGAGSEIVALFSKILDNSSSISSSSLEPPIFLPLRLNIILFILPEPVFLLAIIPLLYFLASFKALSVSSLRIPLDSS